MISNSDILDLVILVITGVRLSLEWPSVSPYFSALSKLTREVSDGV